MAKGGVFQALGNLFRWTIWGLAAVAAVAIWLGWSNRVTEGEDVAEAIDSATEEAAVQAEAAADAAVDEAQEATAKADAATDVVEASGEVTEAASDATPAATDGVVSDIESDLNILAPELSDIRIPGDDATYSVLSVFQRDDGRIEVVSERRDGETTEQTVRLVTCAPLAVGVISEGDAPRNDDPELKRLPLGSAAATIAAMACGAMN